MSLILVAKLAFVKTGRPLLDSGAHIVKIVH